jgi:serine/threonine-protein kinase RsbW
VKTFRGSFKNLVDIAVFVRQASKIAGLDEKETYQVETAVDEACSNIIEHAYGGENKGDIICFCDPEPGCLTVTLKDTGQRFDPADVPPPDRQCCLEDRESHGLGLFFINQLMDEVTFDFSDPKINVLVMTKRKG